jgi:hypothetical protein
MQNSGAKGRFGEGFRMPAGRDDSRALRGSASESPPGRNPLADGCRLWGFDGAAAWVGDALAGVVGGSDDRGSDDRGSEFVAAAAVGWAILA